MLLTLHISNFILIDKLQLDFKAGFSAVTGETGAGKSIIIDALMLALGERLSGRYSRNQSHPTDLTAEFDIRNTPQAKELLAENELAITDSLVIRRVISQDSRSKAFVNDTLVSLGFVQRLAKQLIEVASQHEHQALLRPELQLSILDQYAKHDLAILKAKHSTMVDIHKRYAAAQEEYNKAMQERGYLQYMQEELSALNLKEGEEEELLAKRKLLVESSKIIECLQIAISELAGEKGAIARVNNACRASSKIIDVIETQSADMERIASELEEIAATLQERGAEAAHVSSDADAIEGRLSNLRDTARKYGIEVAGLVDYLAQVESKLALISDNNKVVADLEQQLQEAKASYLQIAHEIQASRKKAAGQLEGAMRTELEQLKMPDAAVHVEFSEREEEYWSEAGIDKVAFKIRTNPGLPMECISKVASGGELSRLMLSFKVLLSGVNAPAITIFDEVDVGVGGSVADSIGRKLAKLAGSASSTQVLSITHQPQVAAHADHHYLVQKQLGQHGNTVSITLLEPEERCQEVARMLSGEVITQSSLAAAKDMLQGVRVA
ncbi:MAG: DNA repair protein RecN [Proteobacteria bacterium]|nr:DNA repair protein RecN [Pseudomonadota bacterium]